MLVHQSAKLEYFEDGRLVFNAEKMHKKQEFNDKK